MKGQKRIFKVIKSILIILVGIFFVGVVWNSICGISEKERLEKAYGQVVEVNGKNMTVEIFNQDLEGPAIVLLPGWGCASPVLEFKPLAERLSDDYTVIIIEPFGYGLSDETDQERTVENITEELRQCILELGYEEYYLMGHSIAGLYCLYWANAYPEEVKGFIGIDPSVPHMTDDENEPFPISTTTLNKLSAYVGKAMNVTGISRLLSIEDPKKAVYADFSYSYTEEELKIFRLLSIDKAYNSTVMNELDWMTKNLSMLEDYKFPEETPVLEFVSKENCQIMPAWEKLHRDTLDKKDEIQVLDGSHYLHFEQKDKIISESLKWIQKLEKGQNTGAGQEIIE